MSEATETRPALMSPAEVRREISRLCGDLIADCRVMQSDLDKLRGRLAAR